MTVLAFVLLALFTLSGLFLLALGLPGSWLLAGGVLLALWAHPVATVTLGAAAALLALCVLAELLEFACSYFGAKRYGVSDAAVWGGLAGGLLGALGLGLLVPVVGTVPGAFAGTFLGAFGVELAQGARREEALRQGFSAFLARMAALALKLAVTLAMAALGLAWLL